jgi:hypothetical protein
MSDPVSNASFGVAARYAAQIRELLALPETSVNARRAMEPDRASLDLVRSRTSGPRGAVVDVQA